MLCGEPPFKGKDDLQILDSVKKGTLEFKKTVWNAVSEKAKSLIQAMIERNIKKRLTIEEVLLDSWFEPLVLEKKSSSMSE